jgi:hypothetical protein
MREKPRRLSARPRLTCDRSTLKRSPSTRLRSTHRQRTTPSRSGSGPASTSRRNSSCCSTDSFRGRPGDLASIRPSAPSLLKRCTQSRSVCRSIRDVREQVLRSNREYGAAGGAVSRLAPLITKIRRRGGSVRNLIRLASFCVSTVSIIQTLGALSPHQAAGFLIGPVNADDTDGLGGWMSV